MSAILNTFTGKNITPKNEAVIYDASIGESGVFKGCALASLGSNQVSIAAGDGIIKGRKFTIEAETIACALATAGTMPGRIYLKMDLSNTTTPLEIKSIAATTLPALTKDEDCNFTNGIYEVAIGTYTASTTAISNLVTVFNKINLHTILKTKAEVTANTEVGRLADALVIKELITNLNGGTATVMPNTAGSFSLDTTFPNDARYNSCRKIIKLFAKRSIVFPVGAYTQVASLTDINMTPTKDQYTPVYSMASGVQVGMARFLVSDKTISVFLFTELPTNTTFYVQFDY